ncbi:hypothetical protein diail_4540 [Diaporthe ilicicola]|nr:hypothetical protein diail_4540 [Diaporthe ilicicola]
MEPEHGLDVELQTLSRICFSPWRSRVRTSILRPERPEYSMLMGKEGDSTSEKRKNVLRIIYNSILGGPKGRSFISVAQKKRIISGITAILFDQESSSNNTRLSDCPPTQGSKPWTNVIVPPFSLFSRPGKHGAGMVASLIEHMLLVDYGLGERPLTPVGSEPSGLTNNMTRTICQSFCNKLTKLADDCRDGKNIWYSRLTMMDDCLSSYEDESSANEDFSDLSLMFYYFSTRRRSITNDEFKRGQTGYTGVLEEMISEIPISGTDRLTRKLSVDMNKLIPRYVRSEESRKNMMVWAARTAVDHGIQIQAPELAYERLMMLSILKQESLERPCSVGGGSTRSRDTTPFEHEPSPPPRYEEAPSYEEATRESGMSNIGCSRC